MRKMIVFCVLLIACANLHAQEKMKEGLFYYSPKGLSFIPPLSRPGLVYDGRLYIGKHKLGALFGSLRDVQLLEYFDKYQGNKTTADILTFTGGVALPILNIFVSANAGRINWPLLLAAVVLNGTGGYLNGMAQKNLLEAALYYDKKMQGPKAYAPQQQSLGFAIAF